MKERLATLRIESGGVRVVADEIVSFRILHHLAYAAVDVVAIVHEAPAGLRGEERQAFLRVPILLRTLRRELRDLLGTASTGVVGRGQGQRLQAT